MTTLRKFTDLTDGEITAVVGAFMGGSSVTATSPRPQSWDFCFEYFRDIERVLSDRQASCMQLGYYLASWGMLRGSSYLFKSTNARHYLRVLDVIEEYDSELRTVTPERFGDHETQQLLVSVYRDLGDALVPNGERRMTLVSKTLMGVWGVFPSLDTYFLRTFKDFARADNRRAIFNTFSEATVGFLGEFYQTHKDEISRLSDVYQTVDFYSGESSGCSLPPAKIIDIYGFNAAFNPVNPT